jgi:phosphatidylglycerol lysyltransferase
MTVVAALLAIGAVLSAATALGLTTLSGTLGSILPFDPTGVDAFDACATAVALGALAIGIRRRKRVAWALGTSVLSAAAAAQLLTLRHPVGGALALVCLVGLVADRVRFQTRTPARWQVIVLSVVVAGALLVAVESVLLDSDPPQASDASTSDLEELLGAVGAWLAFDAPAGLRPSDLGTPLLVLDVGARVAIVGAAIAALRPMPAKSPDKRTRTRARWLAGRFGSGSLLPFQLGADTYPFIGPDRGALVAYGRAGRSAVVLGDPVGPASVAWRTFDAFVEACALDDIVPSVYQASATARGPLVARGFRTCRAGAEAIVDLATFSLEGSRRANLRHTIARAIRGGVTTSVHPAGIRGRNRILIAQLSAIDDEWRHFRAGPELGFTIGRFNPMDLHEVALAIARESDGTPTAFVTFRRTGTDRGWVLDLMRRRRGGTPGALEAALAAAAIDLASLGATTLSLGLAPLARIDGPERTAEERLLLLGGRMVRPLYDVRGLAAFKGKFNPRWEPRYVAFRSRSDLISLAIALLRLHLAPPRRVADAVRTAAATGRPRVVSRRSGSGTRPRASSA